MKSVLKNYWFWAYRIRLTEFVKPKHKRIGYRLILLFNCLFLIEVLLSCDNVSDDLEQVSFRFDNYLNVDGLSRYYLVNLPPDYYQSTDFPVIIALHGAGGSALQCENDYALTSKANEQHYIIVYPEGVRSDGFLGIRTWNAGYCCDYAAENNIDDVKFIGVLIDSLKSSYKIDPRRVYIVGMSNGAMMAYRLACEIPEKIAAIASVSGTMLTRFPCKPSKPVPVLHIHSEQDTKVPPQGGIGLGNYYYPPVDSVLRVWSLVDSCLSSNEETISYENYTLHRWKNNRNEIQIEYYLTKDGGHSWPGGIQSRRIADKPSKAIDANNIIWNFFHTH